MGSFDIIHNSIGDLPGKCHWINANKLNEGYGEKSFITTLWQYMVKTDPNIFTLEEVELEARDLLSSDVFNLYKHQVNVLFYSVMS